MFKITIEGDNVLVVAAQLATLADLLGRSPALTEAPAPKTKAPLAVPEQFDGTYSELVANDDVGYDLLEAVPPAPNTANAVVDAGTGKPVVPDFVEPVKQMTFNDVKIAAAKLAQADTPALKALIEKYGGTNLSSIPKEHLGDFAGEVLAAVA